MADVVYVCVCVRMCVCSVCKWARTNLAHSRRDVVPSPVRCDFLVRRGTEMTSNLRGL
jgi:hypothetical protein